LVYRIYTTSVRSHEKDGFRRGGIPALRQVRASPARRSEAAGEARQQIVIGGKNINSRIAANLEYCRQHEKSRLAQEKIKPA
jgi:hypothetical protein